MPRRRVGYSFAHGQFRACCASPAASGGTLLACSRNRRAALQVAASMPEENSAVFELSETVDLKSCDIPVRRTPAGMIERV